METQTPANGYRKTIYLSGKEGAAIQARIKHSIETDLRFKSSESEFLRHCIRYTLANDGTLTK